MRYHTMQTIKAGNRKTVEKKIIPTEKPKQIDQNRKPHAKLLKPIHFQTPVIKPWSIRYSGDNWSTQSKLH